MENKVKVLIVEDERSIQEFISLNLKLSGFEVQEVSTGEAALVTYDNFKPEVVLLDVMLPGIDGFEVCKQIRKSSPDVAIIMLTAKGQDIDKINGLEFGADDYIVKPFNPLELIARIRALLRRMHLGDVKEKNSLVSGPFEIDFNTQGLLKNNTPIDLTPQEFNLVKVLMENINLALSRDDLLTKAWGEDFFGDPKTLDVHIRRLREKLEVSPSNPKHICTVWGYGYIWKEN
jgi:DNA-binding response OmpR family regulator